jgi:propanediol dehydratase small subunit
MRAAELAQVPDDELLAIYTALRPHRSTARELEAWAVRLDGWGARATAAFVREAAAAYVERGLLAV